MKKKLLKIAILTLAIVMLAGVMAPAAAANWQATPGFIGAGNDANSMDGGQNWYWLLPSGQRAMGWQNINGAWYFFRANGVMNRAGDNPLGSWFEQAWERNDDGVVVIEDGVLVNRNVHGFFREQLAVGQNNEWAGWGAGRIFRVNANGVMSTGWQSIVVNYEFAVGSLAGTWVDREVPNLDGSETTTTVNGAIPNGPMHSVGGHWYYFGDDGVMRANAWVDSNGTWFRLGENGQMLRSVWAAVDGVTYRFAGSGAMVTGWANVGGNWFYMEANGARQSGRWVESNGAWYWLTGTEFTATAPAQTFPVGAMVRNGIFNTGSATSPQWHAFDHSGVWLGQVGQPVTGPTNPWYVANP
ncbi:MAG: hypothetical protein FWC13_11380 [Oscillospiraceae bacterium]|nr:hypothetical protein [Oscillospiraceae bacterium]